MIDIATKIKRISDSCNKIRNKLVSLGLASSTDKIDTLATTIDNIQSRSSSNVTISNRTVTVPAGFYPSNASKTISSVTQATPSISVSSSGLITASSTQSAGYVSSGTKSATKQLTTQAAKTITPSTSAQTAVNSGVYTTGAVKVAAMPTAPQAPLVISVNSSGLITANATQAAGYVSAGTKSATYQLTKESGGTFTPMNKNLKVASKGRYLTGDIYVEGDSNLTPENIVSGVSIFGVNGTASAGGTGSQMKSLDLSNADVDFRHWEDGDSYATYMFTVNFGEAVNNIYGGIIDLELGTDLAYVYDNYCPELFIEINPWADTNGSFVGFDYSTSDSFKTFGIAYPDSYPSIRVRNIELYDSNPSSGYYQFSFEMRIRDYQEYANWLQFDGAYGFLLYD